MCEQWDSFDLKTKDCIQQGCPRPGIPGLDGTLASFQFLLSRLVDAAALTPAEMQLGPRLCLSVTIELLVLRTTLCPDPSPTSREQGEVNPWHRMCGKETGNKATSTSRAAGAEAPASPCYRHSL